MASYIIQKENQSILDINPALLNFCFHSETVIPGDANDPFRCQ
jgi:hypothetical protein